MPILLKNISSLVTVNADGKLQKSGSEMQEIGEIRNAALLFDEKILWVGSVEDYEKNNISEHYHIDQSIDAQGKTVLPGFVDSHTHLVFAGNRSSEFARRLRGLTYQQIAEEGGGILTTMKATRSATIEELAETGRKLAWNAMKHGTTALEIKSGYGLSLKSEINQLEAIKLLQNELPLHISSTFLGAHDFPPEYKHEREKYIDIICNEMIPTVAEMCLAKYNDVFIDKGYYTLLEGEKIIKTGIDYGLKPKVHCDELADVGAAGLAASLGAVSADHLLFVSDTGMDSLKESGTVATLLPGTAYFIRMPYANARKMIEKGLTVALSTDCNPGSSFTENMQLILSLAVINMKMTAEEAIAAATINGAAAIEQSDKMGSLEVGKLSNFIICNCTQYSDIFYHFGINHVEQTWIAGKQII